MKRIAIVGAGVSGLTVAQLLKDRCEVEVFEKEECPGGLIRCKRVDGSLFHICGGHVFNTKNEAVARWFWSKFDQERDFVKADRHSAVCLEGGRFVDYPIENHVWQLDSEIQRRFFADIEEMRSKPQKEPGNFDEFLRSRFGRTLYELYFKPYNDKIWKCDLTEVPLSWLQGKLPMPTPEEMVAANRERLEEKQFVHSSFYYEKTGGSQFIADTLAKGIRIHYGMSVTRIERTERGILIRTNEDEGLFDHVFFCGSIKDIPQCLRGFDIGAFADEIGALKSHGTTAVFCETDPIPYSWFYQPSAKHDSHRFICTGNFSNTNNAPGKMTCTVEFTDEVPLDVVKKQLKLMPYHPRYVTHHYSPCSYPIQHAGTRRMVECLKENLRGQGVSLAGRFAEWEYFNMDAAMDSAMKAVEMVKYTAKG